MRLPPRFKQASPESTQTSKPISLVHSVSSLAGADPVDNGFTSTQVAFGEQSEMEHFWPRIERALQLNLDVWVAWMPPLDRYFQKEPIDWDYYFGALHSLSWQLGSKFQGIRFNHEYRPTNFKDVGFSEWLESQDYHLSMILHQRRQDFADLVKKIKLQDLNPVLALDAEPDPQLRTLFRQYAKFQCAYTHDHIYTLRAICLALGCQLLLYPGVGDLDVSPRHYPALEYTLQPTKMPITSHFTLEVPFWSAYSKLWLGAAIESLSDAPNYIVAMQQSKKESASTDAYYSACLAVKSGTRGFSFWSNWEQMKYISAKEQRAYVEAVGNAVRDFL